MKRSEWVVLLAVTGTAFAVGLNTCGRLYVHSSRYRALAHSKQIGLALMDYAGDHDGAFPSGPDANRCLAQLVPDMGNEKVFFIRGSAWHGSGRFAGGPDDLYETSTPAGVALEPGENAVAFNRAARRDSREDMPLLASAFSARIGTYSGDEAELGGVSQGRYTVVIYADGSGATHDLDRDYQVKDDAGNNLFLAPDCDFVNPALPRSRPGTVAPAYTTP